MALSIQSAQWELLNVATAENTSTIGVTMADLVYRIAVEATGMYSGIDIKSESHSI